jgi:hypothetical protein
MESSSPKTKTTDNQVNKKSSKTTKNQKEITQKKLPQFGQAFSSKNFTED